MVSSSTGLRARTALMLLAALALIGVAGAWLAWHQAEVLVDRALKIVLGAGEVSHRRLLLQADGQILVEDLVFRPVAAQDAMRAERLLMQTPGWRWFLRNALDPELHDARLDRLHLSLTGVSVDDDGALPLPDLGVFGVATASPWDADGCPPEFRWTRPMLIEVGLTPGRPSLQFDYRGQEGDLLASVILETFGASRLQWIRTGTLPGDEDNLLSLATEPSLIRSEQWNVQDQGFVAARNRYCANRSGSGLDERRFVARHVEAVERRLATLGLEADARTRDRYRRFALAGGKVSLSVELPRPMPASALQALHRSAAWTGTVATLDRSGDVGPLQWQRSAPAPSPGVASEQPSIDTGPGQSLVDGFEAVPPGSESESGSGSGSERVAESEAESGSESQRVAESESESATTESAIAAAAPPATGVQVEAQAEAPDEAQTGAPTATVAASPPPEPVAPQSEPPRRTAPVRPATLPAIPPLTRFATPTPESPARAAILATARVAPTRPTASSQETLGWNELRNLRGRTIEVWTRHSPARQVTILEFGNDAVQVSYRIKNSGEAVFSIKRESFVRAVVKS